VAAVDFYFDKMEREREKIEIIDEIVAALNRVMQMEFSFIFLWDELKSLENYIFHYAQRVFSFQLNLSFDF
jgi:hypothetical protein